MVLAGLAAASLDVYRLACSPAYGQALTPVYPGLTRLLMQGLGPEFSYTNGQARSSQAICSVMVLAGLAAAFLDVYRLACSPAYGQADQGFWARLNDPGLPWSDQALDARVRPRIFIYKLFRLVSTQIKAFSL